MIDGDQRIRDGQFAIVVDMNADGNLQFLADGVDRRGNLFGQSPAIGIAEHNRTGPRILSRHDGLQSKVRIRSIAVEEMFGVVQDFASFRFQERDGIADHRQVFGFVNVQHLENVQIPGLADDRHDGRSGVACKRHMPISSSGCAAFATRHPKRAEFGMLQRQIADLTEVFGRSFGVRQRIAALDEIHADFVQLLGNQQLILKREIDSLALAAVSKSRIVDLDSRHVTAFEETSSPSRKKALRYDLRACVNR